MTSLLRRVPAGETRFLYIQCRYLILFFRYFPVADTSQCVAKRVQGVLYDPYFCDDGGCTLELFVLDGTGECTDDTDESKYNQLTPGMCGCNFRLVIFTLISKIDILRISCDCPQLNVIGL